jgi:hypothetical protein
MRQREMNMTANKITTAVASERVKLLIQATIEFAAPPNKLEALL